jgi:hypothetical protein
VFTNDTLAFPDILEAGARSSVCLWW